MNHQILFHFVAVSFLLVAVGCGHDSSLSPQAHAKDSVPAATAVAVKDSWPMFRGDALSDGVARGPLPDMLKVLWKRSFKNGTFESTATIVDGVVYVGSLDGNLYCLDLATGADKWKFNTELGFKAAAAIRDGNVYVGDTDGKFYCLDAATGTKKWEVASEAEINAGANFYKDKVLFTSQDGGLYCVDATSGKLVWKYTIDNMIQCAPTVVDNRCFLAGCDQKLHIVDLDEGKAATTLDIGDPTGTTPAVAGDFAYFGTQGAKFLCINWRKAEIIWTYQHAIRKQPYQSSAAVIGDRVIVGGRDRMVHALDAKSGTETWTFATKSGIDSSPVVVGERVFIGAGDGRLYGLSLTTGEKVFEYEAGGGFSSSPAVAERRLVIGNNDGDLFCFGAP